MKYLLKKYFIFSFSAHAITLMIPALTIHGSWKEFFFASLLLMICFVVIKPLTTILLFPIHVLTLNVSSWLVSAVLVYIWISVDPFVSLTSWDFPGLHIGSFHIAPISLSYWMTALVVSFFLPLVVQCIHMILD